MGIEEFVAEGHAARDHEKAELMSTIKYGNPGKLWSKAGDVWSMATGRGTR